MDKLLKILNENARLSNEQIAAMLNRTESDVAAAIDQYEKEGIIRGYRAVIDWEKTDRKTVTARIEIKVTPKKGQGFEEIAETISQFEEVETVYLMSGGYDIAATVTGKTFQEVALFVAHRLAPLDSVQSTATHFVLRHYKERGVLIKGEPVDERGMGSL